MGSLVLAHSASASSSSSSSVALVHLGNATTANQIACCTASFFSNSSFKHASATARMGVSFHRRSLRVECAHTNFCTPVVETLPDLYRLLGVGSAANAAEIKSSYRKMALRYHPDVCPSTEKEDCSRMFIQVQQAYEILSDPEQRAEYDHHLMHPIAGFAAGILHHRMSWGDSLSREPSEAWKLNWEAQLESLRHRWATERRGGVESWVARMRKTRSCC